MKAASIIWASVLIASSITLAFFSFITLSDVVEGVLIYIAQCLLFAGSVAGLPHIVEISKLINHENNSKNSHKNDNGNNTSNNRN